MAEPQPVILDRASLVLNGVELACVLSHIEITPDVSTTEITTMCGRKEYPGSVRWTLGATLYQSFDPEGTHETLMACLAAGGPVPYSVMPRRGEPVAPTNPEFWGDVIPQPYTLLSGDAGEASTVEIEWSIEGNPLEQINPPTPRPVPPPLDVQAVTPPAGPVAGGETVSVTGEGFTAPPGEAAEASAGPAEGAEPAPAPETPEQPQTATETEA
jgi:hypothetical protein